MAPNGSEIKLFSFNTKNVICRKILNNVVPLQRIYSQTMKLLNILPYYYNISDNILKYANYLIKYARYKNVPCRNGFYTKKYSRIS